MGELLTLQSIDARAVLLPLRRPIVSKVGRFDDWPMILIDVYTREGIVGHSYLEPYLKDALGCIIALVQTLGAAHIGKPIARPLMCVTRAVRSFGRGASCCPGRKPKSVAQVSLTCFQPPAAAAAPRCAPESGFCARRCRPWFNPRGGAGF